MIILLIISIIFLIVGILLFFLLTPTRLDLYTPDPEYDITSSVYSSLARKIKTLKMQGKPLLIKINAHPCAGKTTFISKYKGAYLGCELLDFDNYSGNNRTSSLLQPLKTNTVLFGTYNATYHGKFDNVVYIYVTPRLEQVKAQIVARQKERKTTSGWANATAVLKRRATLLSHVFKDRVQVEPFFYSFKDGLDFCIAAGIN